MAEQINDQKTSGRKFSIGSVLLLTLMVGLASGLAAYEIATIGLANGLGLNTTTLQTNTTNDPAATNGGLRWGRGGFGGQGGLFFRASSQVANVSVTGFNISTSNQLTVDLAYTGSGATPSITIVALSRVVSGTTCSTLSGSLIDQSGWTSPTTVTVNMVGTGSLSSARGIMVLIVPYTGA
ncbi:MAG: hypothetical protein AUF79_06875 [Crenarchaeota archaeon 13_1_20CM_2_51_8]|nr:MAG: hypothetical protein AUF79_06875 [Crenarchaeota archaeon 13_1_20CM_2_51_8]